MSDNSEYTTVRVTNPSKGAKKMAKLTGAKKRAFLKRMAEGKRKAASGRKKNASSRKRRTSRKKNPMKIGGINVKPVAINGLGVAVGAYFGGTVTNMLDKYVISKLGTGWGRTIGFALGGVGTLVLGEWLQKKAKDFPITAMGAGASVPMWLAAFVSAGVMPDMAPATMPPPADTAEGMGRRRRRRYMRGSIQPGQIPGSMSGTIQPGGIPGNMGRGVFGGLLN